MVRERAEHEREMERRLKLYEFDDDRDEMNDGSKLIRLKLVYGPNSLIRLSYGGWCSTSPTNTFLRYSVHKIIWYPRL